MIYQDLEQNHGLCVIDPHGDLVEDILQHIPKSRIEDVIYFNPGDTERPMGLNLLEGNTAEEKDFIALEAMNIMIKLYGEEIFSPRLQDYFRNGCLTLMDDEEEGGAITDVVRLFTDDTWQKYKVKKVKNPIVKSFWDKQMAATGAREKQEMIPYFAAKFGAFVTNTLMRNVVGQVKSAFDFSDVMNNNKILLVNLSKGQVGDLNASLLGMIIVSKLQVSAMRRANQPFEERKDFFLYIDEFQNFVTDSIETILSEARKYRLSLNIAHQYIGQLVKKQDTKIRDAVFGNVGTIMSYKISAQDSEYMAKEMAPIFTDQDLINLDAFKAIIKLSVDNKPTQPFSLSVVPPWESASKPNKNVANALKQLSRLRYGRDKEFVNREILARIGA
jgi:type IV secretory pathway TraG/TraD family ATPase VirD4